MILATGQSVREYLVQHVAIGKYDPGHYSVCERVPSQALFYLHRASALPLRCGIEDDPNFQSPPGHSRRPVRRRQYTMVLVCQGGSVLYIRASAGEYSVFH